MRDVDLEMLAATIVAARTFSNGDRSVAEIIALKPTGGAPPTCALQAILTRLPISAPYLRSPSQGGATGSMGKLLASTKLSNAYLIVSVRRTQDGRGLRTSPLRSITRAPVMTKNRFEANADVVLSLKQPATAYDVFHEGCQ
jgi:hypothetical protein